MKIVSDNPELLEKIYKELKLARIKVKKETKSVDGAMADEVTILLYLYDYIKDNPKVILDYIRGVMKLGKYLKNDIKIELKDGTIISYETYENMSDEELQKVFSK